MMRDFSSRNGFCLRVKFGWNFSREVGQIMGRVDNFSKLGGVRTKFVRIPPSRYSRSGSHFVIVRYEGAFLLWTKRVTNVVKAYKVLYLVMNAFQHLNYKDTRKRNWWNFKDNFLNIYFACANSCIQSPLNVAAGYSSHFADVDGFKQNFLFSHFHAKLVK